MVVYRAGPVKMRMRGLNCPWFGLASFRSFLVGWVRHSSTKISAQRPPSWPKSNQVYNCVGCQVRGMRLRISISLNCNSNFLMNSGMPRHIRVHYGLCVKAYLLHAKTSASPLSFVYFSVEVQFLKCKNQSQAVSLFATHFEVL